MAKIIDKKEIKNKYDTVIIIKRYSDVPLHITKVLDGIIYNNLIEGKFDNVNIDYIKDVLYEKEYYGEHIVEEYENQYDVLMKMIELESIFRKDNNNFFSYKFVPTNLVPYISKEYGIEKYFKDLSFYNELNDKTVLIVTNLNEEDIESQYEVLNNIYQINNIEAIIYDF